MKNVRVLSGPFQGAPILADWRGGKRKILGIYEHELNSWWDEKLKNTDLFYDVGAAEGYLTRGVAHRIKKRSGARIVAFEPGMEATGLDLITKVRSFSNVEFHLIQQLVGENSTDSMTTLDSHFMAPSASGLVKVDVEGTELGVLAGAVRMLSDSNFEWTVEIHGRDSIKPVQAFFDNVGRETRIVSPKNHWLFGAESRSEWTGWLVTI